MIQMWPYTADELAFFTQGAGVLCNPKKETNMTDYNINQTLDQYATSMKMMLGYVPNKDFKSICQKAIELQVESTKLFLDTVNDSFKKLATAGK
jgi:hypothetical protein